MAETLCGSTDTAQIIGTTAERIRRGYEAIQKGHSLGIKPGSFDEPWKLSFHRLTIRKLSKTVPWLHIAHICDAFFECAQVMERTEIPTGHETEWTRMHAYLTSASTAMEEQIPAELHNRETRRDLTVQPIVLEIIPFAEFAALASAEGAANMFHAGQKLKQLYATTNECPLDEREQAWLRRISKGDSLLAIALDEGYSERSFYRALSDLWSRLGVNNRVEAIALANRNGWI